MNNDSDTQITKLENEMKDILVNRSDDYAYGRDLLYSAAERLQDVLESAVDLARENEHPRAIEVATNTATALSDIAKKLMTHQQDIEKLTNPSGNNPQTVNQNLNVKLSTKDLLDLIKSEE